jgi:SAM-dependent methyltransferase
MENILVKLIGYPATVLHGDPPVFDRWCWLKKHLQPGPWRTLDAGCGSGAFTIYAAKIGNEAVGISYDERNNRVAAERAKILKIPNINFIKGDLRQLEKLSYNLGKFNQIICFETIEHIKDDKKLLKDFSFLLKPGGRLLLTTPYKYHRPLYGDQTSLSLEEDGGHVIFGYTHEELKNLLKEFGLEIEAADYISGYFSQQLNNLQRIISLINPRLGWLMTFPLRIFQSLDPALAKFIKYPYLSIGIVAVKK